MATLTAAERPRRGWGIRATLVALTLSGTVPGLGMSAYLLLDDYRIQRQSLIDQSMAHTKAIVAALDRDLASIEANLKILATSPGLVTGASPDLAGFHRRVTAALSQQNITNYVMVDPDGRQVLNTLKPWGTALPANGAPADLMTIFSSGERVLSNLFVGPVTGKPLIAMGVPVLRGDRIAYMLGVGILPERIQALMVREHLPPQWIAVIIDGNGAIVARTHEMERFLGHRATSSLIEHAAAAAEGQFETVTLEGIPINSTFARSSLSDWTVAIGVPKATLLGALQRSFAVLTLVAALLLGAGLFLAWRVGGRIVSSIGHLVPLALQLGAGRPVHAAPQGLHETDAVAAALHTASDMLIRAQYQAHHDPLTGLANRTLLMLLIEKQALACLRNKGSFAVLCIDLDGFKPVNDAHGHATGDRLLQEVARRLTAAVRGADVPARLGGDEFVVMLGDSDLAGARVIADVILKALAAPYRIDGQDLRLGASVGIAAYPQSTVDYTRLMDEADRALYAAKRLGGNRAEAADPLRAGSAG